MVKCEIEFVDRLVSFINRIAARGNVATVEVFDRRRSRAILSSDVPLCWLISSFQGNPYVPFA
jgi:hypothetical protein